MAQLPAALGSQLRRDAGLSFVEYYVLASLSDVPDRSIRLSRLATSTNSELSRMLGRLFLADLPQWREFWPDSRLRAATERTVTSATAMDGVS